MQKKPNTIKAYFKLLNLFDHLIKPILLYDCKIWTPDYIKYNNPTRPLTHSFTQDLRDKFPYMTKYMDINYPILNCVSVPWGSTQKLQFSH